MALTRKFLTALGIEPDKLEEIIDAHMETVNGIKKERDDYKEEADRLRPDAEKLATVQAELESLQEANTNNPYKEKYEQEHSDFEAFKADVSAKEEKAKKAQAYRALLKDAGVSEKRLDAIMKVTAVDEMELADDGTIKDAKDRKDKIKEEWAEFIQTEETKGAETVTPPGSGGASPTLSRAAMVAQKRYEAMYGTKGESK